MGHNRRLLRVAAALCVFFSQAGTAQEIQERTLRFGHLNNPDHPVSLGVKRFAELLAAKSGGKLKVQEFPASELGNELQQQTALQRGVQEMSAPATSSLTGIVREFGLVDLPFAVSTFAQADALLDGPLGQSLAAKLPEKGLIALGYWDLGFRNITTNTHPINRAEDIAGLNIRIIPNQVFFETFQSFGANPIPLPFAEVREALAARKIDAQENPFAVTFSNRFYEVQKYLSATNHVYAANIILVGKRFWDRLSRTEKQLMIDAANESRAYQRKTSRTAAQKALADLQSAGMIYNTIAPAEQSRLRSLTRPLVERLTAAYEPALVRLYNNELTRIRKLP